MQLLHRGNGVSGEIKKMLENEATTMILGEAKILEMLKSQINEFHRIFLIIDALDECPDADSFLRVCRALPEQVHMLFTSRPSTKLEKIVDADTKLEISADGGDIREYLQKSFEDHQNLKHMIDAEQMKNASFRDNVLDIIVEKSQGMQVLPRWGLESC